MVKSGIVIRPAERADIDQLWQWASKQDAASFAIWGADFVYTYPPDREQFRTSFQTRKNVIFLSFTLCGRLVGMCELTNPEEDCITISRLILSPEERGHGRGGECIRALRHWTIEHLPYSYLRLVVYEHNTKARRCYEHNQFYYTSRLIRPGRAPAWEMKTALLNSKERKNTMIHNFDEPVNRRGTEAKKYAPEYYPQDVLPMWIADSDFKAPQPVVDALCERMAAGVYGYPVVSEEYKGAFAYWQKTRFGWEVSTSDVEFVPGVIPGIICAVRALSYPGDNVVINTPNYPPFKDLCDHNGRHLLRNELKVVDGQYAIDFEDLEAKLADVRTKVFILCNPQNPTGRVFTLEELKRIGELCIKHHVIVLSDEIHCDLVYKGHKHIPFGSISKEFADNSIVFMNASKTFNIAGFRSAAFIATNPRLHQAVHEAVLDNKGIGENLGGTVATVAAYTKCAYYADQMAEYLEGNLDIVCDALSKTDKINLIRPEGTFLLWLDCKNMNMSQDELVDFFVKKAKLGLNSGTSFGPEGRGFMRINIATQRSVVKQAMEQLLAALAEL